MAYKSQTLAELRRLTASLNKSGLFPHGHTTEIAAIRGHDPNIVRNAMKGLPAALDAVRSIVEEAERMAKILPGNIQPRQVRQLSIADLYKQSLLPSGYSEITAEMTGNDPSTIRNFLKKQIAGSTSYTSSSNIIEALYQISEMNEEWELVNRLKKVLEKIEQRA